MTTDTFRNCGHPGGRRTPCLGMAIQTGDLIVTGVNLVAEGNWLLRAVTWNEGGVRPVAQHQTDQYDDTSIAAGLSTFNAGTMETFIYSVLRFNKPSFSANPSPNSWIESAISSFLVARR